MTKRKKIEGRNDVENTTHKTKNRGKRTLLKPAENSGAPEGQPVPAPHVV